MNSRDDHAKAEGKTCAVVAIDEATEMSIRIIRAMVLVLALSFASTGLPLEQSPPLSVKDYYLLLPESYFVADRETRTDWMVDPRRGAIVDGKRGYLFARGDGGQYDIFVCLFNRPDRTSLIAVKTQIPEMDDLTYLEFYLYKDGNWSDVTKRVLPVAIDHVLKYEMPRHGTTIRVTRKNVSESMI